MSITYPSGLLKINSKRFQVVRRKPIDTRRVKKFWTFEFVDDLMLFLERNNEPKVFDWYFRSDTFIRFSPVTKSELISICQDKQPQNIKLNGKFYYRL